MASNCVALVSSNCVSNQGSKSTEYPTQTDVNNNLFQNVDEILSEIDIDNLNTTGTDITPGFNLLNVLQYLIDQTKITSGDEVEVTADNLNIALDLKCLTGSCGSASYTLSFILNTLVNEICALRTRVQKLENK